MTLKPRTSKNPIPVITDPTASPESPVYRSAAPEKMRERSPAVDTVGSSPPRNIVICCDGTGNAGGALRSTNVWRIRLAVASHSNDGREQYVIYQDGVGTSSFRPIEILGKAISYGITPNLEDLYARLVNVYRPGDRIYLFGFSRGAFTARLFAYLLYRCGLAKNGDPVDGRPYEPHEIQTLAKRAVAAYKRRHVVGNSGETLDTEFRKHYGLDINNEAYHGAGRDPEPKVPEKGRVPIEFIGVWDTVAAVGLPFDPTNQTLLAFWRRVTQHRGFRWASFAQLNLHRSGHWTQWQDDDLHPMIRNGFHALSVDDERQAFRPVLWNEFVADDEAGSDAPDKPNAPPTGKRKSFLNLQQLWFAGMHANVGGGYPKDELSYVSLNWMMHKAYDAGLDFEASTWQGYLNSMDDLGDLSNSRSGLAIYYRYKPRQIADLSAEVGLTGGLDEKAADDRKPRIHASVLRRISESTDQYAPMGLPAPGCYLETRSPNTLPAALVPPPLVTSPTASSASEGVTQPESAFSTRGVSPAPTVPKTRGYDAGTVPEDLSTEQRWLKYKSKQMQAAGAASTSRSAEAESVPAQDLSSKVTAFEQRIKDVRGSALTIVSGYTRLRRFLYYCQFSLTILFIAVGVMGTRPGVFAGVENKIYHALASVVDLLPGSPIFPIVITPPLLLVVILSIASWSQSKQSRPAPLSDPMPVTAIVLRAFGFMVLAMILRPLAHYVITAIIPFAGEKLVGVLGSPIWFALFAMAFYLVLRLNAYYRYRMHEWSRFAWRVTQASANPDDMQETGADRFAKVFCKETAYMRLFDHRIVPLTAFAILFAVLAFPVWITIQDVVVRIRLHDPVEHAAKQNATYLKREPVGEGKSFAFGTDQVLDTHLHVRTDVQYVIDIDTGSAIDCEHEPWIDGTIETSPQGIPVADEATAQRAVKMFKRVPDAKYFHLCVAVEEPTGTAIPIRSGVPFSVPRPGRLYILVNDVPGFYFNNRGTATLRIHMVQQE